MKRDLHQLADNSFDLLIIGAGIYGACIAWDAALRGLSTAIVDKGDFGHATSANSLKIIHGGFRYLQHLDFRRTRESIRECNTLMRIAPHLVHPLPCLVPTYGHLFKGRELLSLALRLNDLIGFDRNRGLEPQRRLPRGRLISRDECLRLLPGLAEDGLTGGAIWHDCRMYNSERLTLSFILSAARRGATAANYVEATGFLRRADTITGIYARDRLTGDSLEIRAETVVNAAGPWADQVCGRLGGRHQFGLRLAKAVNIAVRPLFGDYAVGLYGKNTSQNRSARFHGRKRLFFVTPRRDQSLIGTTYTAFDKSPDDFKVTAADVEELLTGINHACPAANLTPADVCFVYAGLVPVSGTGTRPDDLRRVERGRIIDHRRQGLKGLISLFGVKYTTARRMAERVVDLVFAVQGRKAPAAVSSRMPLHGGDVGSWLDYLSRETARNSCHLAEDRLHALICNYGTAYGKVLRYFDRQPAPGRTLTEEEALLAAETRHAVRHEMARKAVDVVFRRTETGTGGHPGPERLRLIARVAGQELGWDQARVNEEYQEADDLFFTTK